MAEPLWTSADIEIAAGGTASAPFAVHGISIDTRTLQAGDLFVALTDRRDGHDFVAAAFEAGAAGALVSREVPGKGPRLKVPDVLEGLTALGIAARARSGAIRTAVTGSVGKTSVKEMLARIYQAAGPAHWAERSFNNHWGVPLTLARMPIATQRAIFEIGMSTPGEIAPRSRMVRPHHALITKIAPAHLEGLGSVEAIAIEKSDIFAGLEAGGTILLPGEDDFFDLMAQRARVLCPTGSVETFGAHAGATAQITGYESDGIGSTVSLVVTGIPVKVDLAAVGEHWAYNVAAALLMASLTGLRVEEAAEALSGFGPPAGRGTAERLALPGGGAFVLVDDAYNANPESMRAALAALAERPPGRRLVALGEMLEIGPTAAAEHAGLAPAIEAASAEIAFLAGKDMGALAEALPGTIQQHYELKAGALLEAVKNALRPDDVLLIKGSNASGMGKLAAALRQWSEAGAGGVMGRGAERPARGSDAI